MNCKEIVNHTFSQFIFELFHIHVDYYPKVVLNAKKPNSATAPNRLFKYIGIQRDGHTK